MLLKKVAARGSPSPCSVAQRCTLKWARWLMGSNCTQAQVHVQARAGSVIDKAKAS